MYHGAEAVGGSGRLLPHQPSVPGTARLPRSRCSAARSLTARATGSLSLEDAAGVLLGLGIVGDGHHKDGHAQVAQDLRVVAIEHLVHGGGDGLVPAYVPAVGFRTGSSGGRPEVGLLRHVCQVTALMEAVAAGVAFHLLVVCWRRRGQGLQLVSSGNE